MHWQQSRPKSKQLFLPDSLWIFDWTQWVSRSESCCILAGAMSRSNLYFCELLRVYRTMAHHSAAGKSTGAGQAQFVPFCPIQFARISISFHFTLSYASMSRGSSRYPIVLLIRIIKAQPQSTSHMWLLRICLLMEQEEESGKKRQHCNWCGLFASFGQFTSWVGVHCTRLGKWANAPGRIW